MNDQEKALIEMLAEHADSRVEVLVEQVKRELHSIADKALARALERYFRPRVELDNFGRDNGCCASHHVA